MNKRDIKKTTKDTKDTKNHEASVYFASLRPLRGARFCHFRVPIASDDGFYRKVTHSCINSSGNRPSSPQCILFISQPLHHRLIQLNAQPRAIRHFDMAILHR